MSQSQRSIQAVPLSRWAEKILLAKGVSPADATRVVEVLVTANLRAVDSHGVFTCLRPYLERIDQGKINLEPEMEILRDQGATLLLDGDLAFGQVAAWEAMELAMERAPIHGIGMVSVTHSTHLGMASFYPLMAVHRNMIGLTMTNCKAAAVPTFGTDPRLGTNPLSLAAPAGKHPAFELDMATTVVSGGKVYTSHLAGKQLPEGWVVDEEGRPLTDSTIASQKGRYLPLGGDPEHGSHKGYGLGLMVDILCGVLSGGNIGPAMQAGENYHLLAAIDIKAFQDPSDFKAMMDTLIDSMHDTPTVPGQERVYVPGEMEHEAVQERSLNGIPVPPAVLPWLEQTSREANVPPPWDLTEQASHEE